MNFGTKTSEILFCAVESTRKQLLDVIDKNEFQTAKKLIANLREFVSQIDGFAPEVEKGFFDDLFVINKCIDLIEAHFKLWKAIINDEFSLSWISLQDGLDAIRYIKKFSRLNFSFYENQLLGLEQAYPYKVFASAGLVVDCYICNICGFDIDSFECPHLDDELYDGILAKGVPNNVIGFDHVSIVENPKDKRCVVEYRDDSRYFQLLQYLSNALKAGKFRTSSFRGVEISKRKILNPSYISLGRNERCYCGSEVKFKKCCISQKELLVDHFDFIFSDSSKAAERTERLLEGPRLLSLESLVEDAKINIKII